MTAGVLYFACSTTASAGWEFGAGAGDEIFGEIPVTAQLSYLHGERFEQVVTLGVISPRRNISRDISPTTSYLSYVFRIPWRRVYLGLGVALASDTSPVISSHWGFNETLGWRITDRWQLELRHISNNGREGRNIGENLYTLIYRFD